MQLSKPLSKQRAHDSNQNLPIKFTCLLLYAKHVVPSIILPETKTQKHLSPVAQDKCLS